MPLLFLFPRVFTQAEVIVPADMIYRFPPWSNYAPEQYQPPYEAQNPELWDALTPFHAQYVVCKEQLIAGEWPLWNPWQQGGMPLMANYQTAVFYPPRLLHLFLDVPVATTLCILLKLWLCGFTAFICARCLGLSAGAARMTSFGWMLCSFNVLFCYWPLPDVAAWAPLLILGAEWLAVGRDRRGFYVLAIGAALILLAGHPETAVVFGLGTGLYFLLRLTTLKMGSRESARRSALAMGAWLLALGVAAVQLVPFVEYLVHSYSFAHRSGVNMAESFAHAMPTLACLWTPRFAGSLADRTFWGDSTSLITMSNYVGMGVWLAMPFAFMNSAHRRIAQTIAVAASVFALIAWNAPLFGWVHHLPVLRSMYGYYYVGFSLFALMLLAGMGVDNVIKYKISVSAFFARILPVTAVAVAVSAAIYSFYSALLRTRGEVSYVMENMGIAVFFAVLGVALLFLLSRKKFVSVMLALFVFSLSADLIVAARGQLVTAPRDAVFPPTALTSYLQDFERPTRVAADMALLPVGFVMPYGVEEWMAYDGLYPERTQNMLLTLEDDVWGRMEPVFGMSLYLHNPELPRVLFPLDEGGYEFMTTLDGIEVYRHTAAFHRAFVVHSARVMESEAAMFARMREFTFEPRREVLLERPLARSLPIAPDEDEPGTARVVHHGNSQVVIKTESAQDGILVLSDAWFPGWQASIDGAITDIFPAYYAFRGVYLPAGQHEVVFEYNPLSFKIGLWISCLSLMGSAFLVILLLRTKRKNAGY